MSQFTVIAGRIGCRTFEPAKIRGTISEMRLEIQWPGEAKWTARYPTNKGSFPLSPPPDFKRIPRGARDAREWRAHHRHRRLLRARRERPCGRSAAEQRDEIAPFHCRIPPTLDRAGPDTLADELDHRPALGRWRCWSLLGLPSPAQHKSRPRR